MSRRHHPKTGAWIRACVAVIYPTDTALFRLDFRHLQRIPPSGGVVLAVNHLSYIDTIVIARFVWQAGRIPRFLVKSDLFHVPGLGRILRGARQIPVYRGTEDAAASLRDAASALDRGDCVIIYPEGTITHDPHKWPMQGRTGIARLALARPDVPVVPIGQWGAHLTFDSLRRRVRPFPRQRMVVQAGHPLDLSAFHDAEPTGEVLRELTDTVMAAVRDEVAAIRGVPAPATFFRLHRRPGTRRARRAGRPDAPATEEQDGAA